MFLTRSLCSLLLLFAGASLTRAAGEEISLRTNDVVGFVGGADVAAAQFSGHLESLLAVKFPGARFRNFGWEGDTVFAQPRDFGFPPLAEHLKRAGVTVLFIEFGRAEALSGRQSVSNFFFAMGNFVAECSKQTPRLVLVTPPPFETPGGLLPDLAPRNAVLADHVEALRAIARRRSLPVVDLFAEFTRATDKTVRLTDNGFQLTPRGHARVATAWARQLGFADFAARAGAADEAGVWTNTDFERLRQTVIEKNRLWFNYWRPQNWAFLGGDRTEQPSSRDHRDPKVRWFPAEMERWRPLVEGKEAEIERLAEGFRRRR